MKSCPNFLKCCPKGNHSSFTWKVTFFKKAIKRKIVDKYFEKSTNLGTLLTSLTVVNRVVTSHVYILAFPA